MGFALFFFPLIHPAHTTELCELAIKSTAEMLEMDREMNEWLLGEPNFKPTAAQIEAGKKMLFYDFRVDADAYSPAMLAVILKPFILTAASEQGDLTWPQTLGRFDDIDFTMNMPRIFSANEHFAERHEARFQAMVHEAAQMLGHEHDCRQPDSDEFEDRSCRLNFSIAEAFSKLDLSKTHNASAFLKVLAMMGDARIDQTSYLSFLQKIIATGTADNANLKELEASLSEVHELYRLVQTIPVGASTYIRPSIEHLVHRSDVLNTSFDFTILRGMEMIQSDDRIPQYLAERNEVFVELKRVGQFSSPHHLGNAIRSAMAKANPTEFGVDDLSIIFNSESTWGPMGSVVSFHMPVHRDATRSFSPLEPHEALGHRQEQSLLQRERESPGILEALGVEIDSQGRVIYSSHNGGKTFIHPNARRQLTIQVPWNWEREELQRGNSKHINYPDGRRELVVEGRGVVSSFNLLDQSFEQLLRMQGVAETFEEVLLTDYEGRVIRRFQF